MAIRWGILGAAKFARTTMGPAIHAASGATLAGLATSSPEKAEPFEAFAPGLRVFSSYDALIADPDIDAVYVPLPNHLHVPMVEACLKAGKPVLSEKPIALKADQIEGLIDLRDRSGCLAAEAYMIAHHPQWHRVTHLLADGAIGPLRHIEAVFTYNNPDLGNIRFDATKGGGSLPDIGVYTLGCMRLATGQEPTAITHADLDLVDGVDMAARVSLRFDDVTATSFTAMNTHKSQHVTFYGRDGRITLPAPFNPGGYGEAQLILTQADGNARVERWPAVDHYVLQVEAFGRSIRDGAAYPWSLEDAQGTQAVIDAVYA
ncbi:MAG: Gfo/Idh/MocA family oxidoreductase, partial [Pseudomonadota bacterium]